MNKSRIVVVVLLVLVSLSAASVMLAASSDLTGSLARDLSGLDRSPQGNGGATVLNVSVGSGHACVTMSNGRLLCWGSQNASAPVLGDGTTAIRYIPVDVVSVTTGATNVASGGTVSCAIVNGGVKCWGGNTWGQLGTG